MRRGLPVVGRVAGGLLVVSGALLIAYWLPALSSDGRPNDRLASWFAALSGPTTSTLDAHKTAIAMAAWTGTAAVVMTRVWRHRSRAASPQQLTTREEENAMTPQLLGTAAVPPKHK